ncbi:MAG: long-chain fatty acid--CoA ligase [Sneathiellaceae bacterium]
MLGHMMDRPLLVSGIVEFAATAHGQTEIVARRIDGEVHRYTYRDYARRCRQLANAVTALGIRDGDVVGSLAWNTHQHLELFYGISGTGAVLHTINPRLFDEQLLYIVNHAEDRWLFVDAATLEVAERLAPRLPTVRGWIFMGAAGQVPQSSLPNLLDYEALLAAQDDSYAWPAFDERQASTICYTSGTTGQPKGVVNTHRSTILSALYMSTADMIGGYEAGAVETVMPIAPLFHGNGWQMVYTAPLSGQRMVLPGRNFEPDRLYELMTAEKVTLAAGVPTIWLGLVDHLQRNGLPMPPSLRVALTAGTKAPPSLMRILQETYKLRAAQTWGMTEALGVTKASPPPGSLDRTPEEQAAMRLRQGRMGFLAELRLVDDAGQPVAHDGKAQGNLQARGPCVAAGYLKQENVTIDGWFPTGDIARLSADGSVEIVDRAKDVIKSGGEWIPSVQVEAAAMEHPEVAQAAVIGIPHPKWQERPLLLVVPRAGTSPSAAAIQEHLRGRIAKWWIPEEIRFVAELPMTATGKIHKVTLRDTYGNALKAAG